MTDASKISHPNSIVYIAICSSETSPGVKKKVIGFTGGASKNGYKSRAVTIRPDGFQGVKAYIREIILAKEDYVVVRYLPKIAPVFFFLGFYLKIFKRKLIIDVPTPMKNHLEEISSIDAAILKRIILKAWIYLMGSFPFLSAYRVIQYAREGFIFSMFVKNKNILVGNGVDVESIHCREAAPDWPNTQLNLVAVGTIAFWHGWDKLIDVIDDLNKDKTLSYAINLTIVGEGPDLHLLKQQVDVKDLSSHVKFTGFLEGKQLYDIYEASHLGVGSLGWERIGVNIASPLKSREYLAAGLPFFYSTADVDFSVSDNCALFINAQEDNEEIKDFFRQISLSKLPSPQNCRNVAEERLDFSQKIAEVLS